MVGWDHIDSGLLSDVYSRNGDCLCSSLEFRGARSRGVVLLGPVDIQDSHLA